MKMFHNHKQKEIKTNIYRIQANGSIICGYFCIEFVDFMLKGENLIDYATLFSFSEYGKKMIN